MKLWILSSSLLILIIIGSRSLLKGRVTFRVQYAMWLVVLLRLLIPFSVGRSPVSVENVIPASAPVIVRPQQQVEASAPPTAIEFTAAMPEQAETLSVPAEMTSSQSIDFEKLLCIIWMIGTEVIILSGVLSNLLFQRKLRRSRIAFSDCKDGLPIYIVHWLRTPCLAGLFRPNIYLTEGSAASPVRLRHVLAHEKMHFQHGDHFWAWMRLVALALHWYNPLVWAAAILSKRDAELACDEAVLRQLGDSERGTYGETLLSLSIPHVFRPFSLSTSMSESKKSLRERIVFIAHSPHTKLSALLVLILLCSAAVCITFPGSAKASFTGEKIQDTFQSEDESVTVHLDLPQKDTFFPEDASVYHLKYHEISTHETTRIVSAIFGEDAPIYQVPPEQRDAMAWDAYGTQEDFDRWLAYAKWLQTTDYPAIAAGDDSDWLKRFNTRLSDFIEKYDHTDLYESMPHNEDRQLITLDGSTQYALVEKDGIPYYVTHYVQVLPEPAEYHMYISPLDADVSALYPYLTLLDYGSEAITQTQIQTAEQTVKDLITEMGLDGWEIKSSSAYPYTSKALARFFIRIILEHRYDPHLTRCDDPFPLENPVDQIAFEFSSDGRLYRMEYICPFDVERAEKELPLSYEEAVQAVKAYCSATTASQFGTVRFVDEKSGKENELVEQTNLVITDLQPGYAYVGKAVPYHAEENESPSLIPAVAVYGTTTLKDQNGGEISIDSAKDASWAVLHDDTLPLFILNGLDGSLVKDSFFTMQDTDFFNS